MLALAALLSATLAYPQSSAYPARPLRMVVPFAPGGPNDVLGRMVGQKLHELWGQPVVVENRGGLGGTIGMAFAAKLPADGYHIAMGGSSNLAVAPSLYRKLAYDSSRDFTMIANVAHVPYALGVNPVVPARNVRELIAVAKRQPGLLNYASSGVGSMSALAAELLKSLSGAEIVHVPYKGTAPALTEVVSGQVDMMLADVSLIQRFAESGKLRMIAVTGSRRSAAAPAVPTMTESGLKGYVIEPWFGVVGPDGIPREIVEKLNTAIADALRSAELVQRLNALGYEPLPGTPEQFTATLKRDLLLYADIVRRAGISGTL